MRRIEDVFDVWFDSGSMPYAQVHYPFENQEWFDEHAPADFIVEYIGQTRGWFYVMHVLSVRCSTGRRSRVSPATASCSAATAEDVEVAAQLSRCQRGVRPRRLRRHALVPHGVLGAARRQPRRHRGGIRAVREFLLPLWNAWYFFATYANAAPRRLRGALAHRLDERAGPLHPRADRRPRARRRRRPGALDSTTAAARCATSPRR
jgi:isoleucyl-tRNA synthetase